MSIDLRGLTSEVEFATAVMRISGAKRKGGWGGRQRRRETKRQSEEERKREEERGRDCREITWTGDEQRQRKRQ